MQIEQKWVIPQTVSYLEQIKNNKYYEETTELEKWQSKISREYWREKGKGRLKAKCHKITDYVRKLKGRLNLSCKITTAANVALTESLLDNWLKNNHITVDKIYYHRSLFVFFTEF